MQSPRIVEKSTDKVFPLLAGYGTKTSVTLLSSSPNGVGGGEFKVQVAPWCKYLPGLLKDKNLILH